MLNAIIIIIYNDVNDLEFSAFCSFNSCSKDIHQHTILLLLIIIWLSSGCCFSAHSDGIALKGTS